MNKKSITKLVAMILIVLIGNTIIMPIAKAEPYKSIAILGGITVPGTYILVDRVNVGSATPNFAIPEVKSAELYKNGVKVTGYTMGDIIDEYGDYKIIAKNSKGTNLEVYYFSVTKYTAENITEQNSTFDGPMNLSSDETICCINEDINNELLNTICNSPLYYALYKNGEKVQGYNLYNNISEEGSYTAYFIHSVVTNAVYENIQNDIWPNYAKKYVFTIANSAQVQDQTPPTITGIGKDPSIIIDTAVTPVVEDTNLEKVELYLEGNKVEGYTCGDTLYKYGNYRIVAKDAAGNTTEKTFHITKYGAIEGYLNGPTNTYSTFRAEWHKENEFMYYDVVPNIEQRIKVVKDNVLVSTSFFDTLTEDGTYTVYWNWKTISIEGTSNPEGFENFANVNTFVIDTEDPTIIVESVNIGRATPKVTDKNLRSIKLYKDEEGVDGYNLGDEIEEYGNYKIVATDLAGNTSTRYFSITKYIAAEKVYLDGPLNLSSYGCDNIDPNNQPIKVKEHVGNEEERTMCNSPLYYRLDKGGQRVTGYNPFYNISEDGSYVAHFYHSVGMKIEDVNNNNWPETANVVTFVIDQTAPTIKGIENNTAYSNSVTPTVEDANIQTVELYKDEQKVEGYTAGTEISNAGNYQIIAVDKAGNTTTVKFEINSSISKGDVNGDKIVSPTDLLIMKKHLVRLITLSTEQIERADLNGDNKVTTLDLLMIKRLIVGL